MPGRNGLISTAELAEILGQPDLRLFDCTTYLEPAPEGSSLPYLAVPGRHTFEAGHIPGADFLDLQGEFSDSNTELRFMMPDVAQLEAAFGRHGVSNDSQVVLYSIGTPMWATRFWWMLTSLGFENVAVLDGGLDKWKLEGRAARNRTGEGISSRRRSRRNRRPGFFVDKHETLAATVRAGHRRRQRARPAIPQGTGAQPLRPARPRARQLQRVGGDAARSRRPRPSSRLRRPKPNSRRRASRRTSAWSPIAAAASRRPIDLFLLHQLGYDNLTLYDGSMGEWAKDTSLPIETG